MTKYFSLAVFLALVFAAGSSGAVFQAGPWYAGLNKPSWTPPGWLFGPVWAVLYVMIAVAGWLIWEKLGWSGLLALWGVQLVFNAAWSWIMFGRHEIGWAFADVVALWLAVAAFILAAWPVSQTAALLFLPYLAWATFAGALNFEVWRLNAGS